MNEAYKVKLTCGCEFWAEGSTLISTIKYCMDKHDPNWDWSGAKN